MLIQQFCTLTYSLCYCGIDLDYTYSVAVNLSTSGVNLLVSNDSIWFDFDSSSHNFIQNQFSIKNNFRFKIDSSFSIWGLLSDLPQSVLETEWQVMAWEQSVYKIMEFYILNCKLLKCKHTKSNLRQKPPFIYKLAQIKTFWQKNLTNFKFSVNSVTSSSCIKLIDKKLSKIFIIYAKYLLKKKIHL